MGIENLNNVSEDADRATKWDELTKMRQEDKSHEGVVDEPEDEPEADDYDQSLYASRSEYLAAQEAAAGRETVNESEELIERPMTVRDYNRQMMREVLRERKGVPQEVLSQESELETIESGVENVVSEQQDSQNLVEIDEKSVEEGLKAEHNDGEIRLTPEEKLVSVTGLLDASMPYIEQLVAMNQGSRSGEEAANILITMNQKMLEQTGALLKVLQEEKSLGKVQLQDDVYQKDMSEEYNHSRQALERIREGAMSKGLPRDLLGGIIYNVQTVENNLQMIDNLLRSKSPNLSKEKQVQDEAEDRKIFRAEF